MPSVSPKQKKFMRAVANSPKFAKKVGVPQSVGKEFEMKDMKKMKMGGMADTKMGKVKTSSKPDGVATKGKTKGTMVKMAAGGMPMVEKDGKKVPAFAADGKGKMAKGGTAKVKMMNGGMPKTKMMKRGGSCK